MLKSMLTHAREIREIEGEAADAGFTLIELMVVLLIIAILLAIAIPTFLGVTGSANDRASQSNVTNALTEAKALYQNNSQSYGFPTASLQASAPEFTWGSQTACTAANGPNCVSFTPVDVVNAGDGAGFIIANLSKTGTCWYVVTLEANPSATSLGDTAPAYQAISGTAAGDQESGGAAMTTAGTYYSQVKSGTTMPAGTAGCNAKNPVADTGGAWNWGSNYASAPNL